MDDYPAITFIHPEAHGEVTYEPVPLRCKLALAARNSIVATAVIGVAWIALAVAPVAFLSAFIPSFLISLVIMLRK